jgi:hypothetical protein
VFVHEGSILMVTGEGFIHIGFYYKLCLSSRNFMILLHTCNNISSPACDHDDYQSNGKRVVQFWKI